MSLTDGKAKLLIASVVALRFLLGDYAQAQTSDPTLSSISWPERATKAHVAVSYGQLPLSFEANEGQTNGRVKFLSRGSGYTLFLTSREAVLALASAQAPGSAASRSYGVAPLHKASRKTIAVRSAVLRMNLVGANAAPTILPTDELPGKSNYFIGNDPKNWHTDIPTYAEVKYDGVYPGVDLVYHGNQRELEYDFIIFPGANPRAVTLGFEGTERLTIDAQGNLVISSKEAEVHLKKPVVYQQGEGIRHEVAGAYRLKGKNQVGFEIAAYDVTKPLVIDPVLTYSTYLGGSGFEHGNDIAVDSAGSAYVTGYTTGGFPTTPGAFQTTFGGFLQAFVSKLTADGSSLVYSTYLGGTASFDIGNGIAVDSAGSAYVTGLTTGGFPTTPGASQTTSGGGADAFVSKLSPTGSSLVYSTYLGGPRFDSGDGIAVDSAGDAYVTGVTTGSFPTTAGAFQTTFFSTFLGAFVAKLSADGSSRVYSTYLGANGQGNGIAADSAGSAYVTGYTLGGFPTTAGAFQTTFGGSSDAFVTKLSRDGSSLVYSTYLGGVGGDIGNGIAVDSAGNAYLIGSTTGNTNPATGQVGNGFPTTPGAYQTTFGGGTFNLQPFVPTDAFITKVSADGSSLVYSTYLGGSGNDVANGIAVDSAGNAYVTGFTTGNFPTTLGAPQTTFGGGTSYGDAFVTKLSAQGSSLGYSTYLGGSGDDVGDGIAVDSAGNAYVAGFTSSTNFPTTPGAFLTTFPGGFAHAFVAKLTKGPIDLINDLITLVQSFNLEKGIANSLDVKLQDAIASLIVGDPAQACSDISNFTGEVSDQSGVMLTVAQATQLITAAIQIRAAQGCP